jgi:propionyl-CoA synthetase
MENSNDTESLKKYEEIYENSITPGTREEFWYNEAQEVDWFQKPIKGEELDDSNIPFYRWFKNATTNICYNCVDRHIEQGRGDYNALIWESAYVKGVRKFTYKELQLNTIKIAQILKDNGVEKGDRVIIYMPMIPEAIFSMLACARLGAIHSVVFGGFAANELAD